MNNLNAAECRMSHQKIKKHFFNVKKPPAFIGSSLFTVDSVELLQSTEDSSESDKINLNKCKIFFKICISDSSQTDKS